MKKKFLKLLAILLLVSVTATSAETVSQSAKSTINVQTSIFRENTVRNTEFGVIKGKIDTEHNVLIWTGVPYAKAPTDELRWKKPVNPDKWSGILNTEKSGNIALQASGDGIAGSEDCLNLDIYRPNTDSKNLPVILYIHGGNNQGGKSGEITGNALVNDLDAIFISVNYRLGPLGFNPLPALNTGDNEEDSGNYALLDMAKALDWTKNNIANFGGNPENITISGFSAGGRDVMAMLISPTFQGKFQKAVSFSGGMTIADKAASEKVFAKAIAPLAVQDNIKKNEQEAYKWLLTKDPAVKTYLYGIKAERLAPLMGNAGIRMSVFPHLYNDGNVIPENGFETKNYNPVPLLMLTGSSEFSMFAKFDPYFGQYFKDDQISGKGLKEFNFASKYGGKLYGLFNVEDSAEKMFANYKADIYGMEIKFGDNKEAVGEKMALYGAFHGVFVPLLDTDSQNYTWLAGDAYNSAGAQELSLIFKKYLYNFIRTGNPNGENLVYWDKWSKENEKLGKSLLYLDADTKQAYSYMGKKEFTYKDVLNEMDRDNTITKEAKKKIISEVLNGRWFSGELDKKYRNKQLWPE